jgi:hypothetical protein
VLALLLAAAPVRAEVGPSWSPQQPPAPAPVPAPVGTVEPLGGPLEPIRLQQPQPPLPPPEDSQQQAIQLTPPGPERVYRLESEASLQERMRQEAKNRGEPRLIFPDEPILSRDAYRGREWPQRCLYAEPNVVCYGRLLFEEKNMERYGWDLGILSPVVSAGWFFKDVVLLPYHLAEDPGRCYECSSGYCLPGDPVPFLLYPPNLSISGAVVEAGSILAVLAIFP